MIHIKFMNVHIELDLNISSKEEFLKKNCFGIYNLVFENSEVIEKINNFELSFNE